tara:strand:- start:586 stop:1470 length:885 start_codon:yes stop_codon:yes gene_type:complete
MSDKPTRMSDSDLKEQLADEANFTTKQALVKETKFPTEIIDLPSKGIPYPEDNPLSSGKLEIKYMTAKEEDILTTQSYIQQGIVLDKLFKEMIISNGEGKAVKYNDLLVGDKNAVMVAARVLGYGKDYEVTVTDPFSPEDTQTMNIDLTEIPDKPLNKLILDNPNVNTFEWKSPISKKTIKFKLMTHGTEKKIEYALKDVKKKQKKLKDPVDRSLTTRYKNIIVAVDGNEDINDINKFVDNDLLAMESRQFRAYIKELQPDIDMSITFVSDVTGDEREMEIPIEVSFFWPDSGI